MAQSLVIGLLLVACYADIYLHFPRGSNNRLDDNSRDRWNGNRLFNSENNNRGGDNRGMGQEFYYSGSILSFSWTFDQGCHGAENHCDLIIQYACDPNMRDGYYTWASWESTIPYFSFDQQMYCSPYGYNGISSPNGAGISGNCTQDFRYGEHEPFSNFDTCWRTSRNMGLWTGDQNMNGLSGAVSTRQNPTLWSSQYGYECPEERDYYPWWGPSIWRDVAILTDTVERCDAFTNASFNVAPRYQCVMYQEWHDMQEYWVSGYIPITAAECADPSMRLPPNNMLVYNSAGLLINAGNWTMVESQGIAPPVCVQSPRMRNNALSSSEDTTGFPAVWNWTVPVLDYTDPLAQDRCVLRIRYNVTSGELPWWGWGSDTTVDGSVDWRNNSNHTTYNGQTVMLPTNISIWETYGLSFDLVQAAFTPSSNGNVGRGYVYASWPTVDIWGLIPEGGLLPQGGSGNASAVGRVYLSLGIDTAETGRVFQDRTHTFGIRPLPAGFEGYTIHNLGVEGKRGNIVQVFPGTEYDYSPFQLEVEWGDVIHIQWTGSNYNPQGNAGSGPAGFDRSNIIVLAPAVYWEAGEGNDTRFTSIGHWTRNYPARIDSWQGRFLNFSFADAWRLAVPALNSAYNNLGLRQITCNANTTYHYIGTRNNNFSNRGQKGILTILPSSGPAPAVISPETLAAANGAGLSWARIQYPLNDRLSNIYNIYLSDGGPGGSSFASHYVFVYPRLLAVPDKGYIALNIDHKWVPFTYGEIYWYQSIGDEGYELFTKVAQWSWNGDASATAMINMGGYYAVVYVVNGSAVGGFIIGVVGVAVMVFLAYRRFGCRCFNKTQAAPDQAKEGLLPASAPTSTTV